MIRCRKLLLAAVTVLSFSILVGGCVSVKDRFVGIAERAPGLNPDFGRSVEPRLRDSTVPLLACGLQEVSPKEAGLDPDAFWKESQISALREHLERRELKPLLEAMQLFSSKFVQVGFVPVVGAEAGIAWEERGGQRQAVALIKQENGTLNIHPDGREELWTLLGAQAVRDLVEQLRKQNEFQALEKELAAYGRQLALAQSLGVTEATSGRGLLYLAVAKGLTGKSVVTYYRVELSGSGKGGYQLQGAPVDLCGGGEISKLGFEDGASMSLVGAYETSPDGAELQVVRLPRDPCLFGLGGLACLNQPCFDKIEVEGPHLDDLLMIIKSSPEYQQLRGQLLSEVPESAWYIYQSQDSQVALVVFSLDKEIRNPDHFVVYPSLTFSVDRLSRRVIEVAISQVDEETLDRAYISFLKSPRHNKTVQLNPAVTERLRAAKQARIIRIVRTGSSSSTLLSRTPTPWGKTRCVRRAEPILDPICDDICRAACIAECMALPLPPSINPTAKITLCSAICGGICRGVCSTPAICTEYETIWSQFSPQRRHKNIK